MLKALQLWFDKKFPEPPLKALAERELRMAQQDLLVAEHQHEYHTLEACNAEAEAIMLRERIARLQGHASTKEENTNVHTS